MGDVFVLQPSDHGFYFGRVVMTGVSAAGFPGANLIYIFRHRRPAKLPVPSLLPKDLLVPPVMTNNLPWVRGYFEFVEARELEEADRLRRHVFRGDHGWLFDESGRRVEQAEEPIGDWALHSFRSIDDVVSEALGIPLAP